MDNNISTHVVPWDDDMDEAGTKVEGLFFTLLYPELVQAILDSLCNIGK